MHNENNVSKCDEIDAMETASGGTKENEIRENDEGTKPTSGESLLKNWPLMSSIIIYCVFSLHDMAYTEVHLKLIKCNIFFSLLVDFSTVI